MSTRFPEVCVCQLSATGSGFWKAEIDWQALAFDYAAMGRRVLAYGTEFLIDEDNAYRDGHQSLAWLDSKDERVFLGNRKRRTFR